MTNPDLKALIEKRCGYFADFQTFTSASPYAIRSSLESFLSDASESQVRAWNDEIPVLQEGARGVMASDPAASAFTTILEYELPLESRRPDVVLLENGAIVVLEFKGKLGPDAADIDQVSAYARDLRSYHRECAPPREVFAILVATRYQGPPYQADGTWIVGPEKLEGLLERLSHHVATPIDRNAFLSVDAYCPLPTLVRAARELFEKRTLRRVWRAEKATDPSVQLITDIVHEAARTKSRRLVLLTGLPGAGKTLVGLRLVHAGFLDDLSVAGEHGKPTAPSVFLSGNGPLVEVLRYELSQADGTGKTFVRGVKDYIKTYSNKPSAIPGHHLLVFDEAQRAWDAQKVAEKHPWQKSEPELFVEIAQRIPDWCVVLGLIGTGQEIHGGEEGGLIQWRRAIENSEKSSEWQVHVPPAVVDVFSGSKARLLTHGALSLDSELRYHLAPRVHGYIEALLTTNTPSDLKGAADELFAGGYRLHITRDLNAAKQYALKRYAENREARFGLLASSRDKDLVKFGVPNGWADKVKKIGPWFSDGQESELSCRKLRTVATEFDAQGLELDLGLVCWGTDFMRTTDGWSNAKASRYKVPGAVKNPLRLRLNSYRVLLTRGRDGNVVFVPALPELTTTYEFLVAAGFRPLKTDVL